MSKVDLIVKTFVDPILFRIEDAIMELDSAQKEEEKIQRLQDNLTSIVETYLKNCEREIENGFPYFHDLQLNLPNGITLEGMTKDFIKFHDSISNCIKKIDLNGDLNEVSYIFSEMKQKTENYKQTVKSITSWDKEDPIQKTSDILEEIENMENELNDIVEKDNSEDAVENVERTNSSEEMSAYDRFMQVINEQDDKDLSVDDIINDIKMSVEIDESSKKEAEPDELAEIEIKPVNLEDIEEEIPEEYLYQTVQDFNNYVDEINKDDKEYNLNKSIKDFNDYIEGLQMDDIPSVEENDVDVETEENVPETDEISNLVYSYVNLNKSIEEKDRKLISNKFITNKFINRLIAQLKLNKEILEVKLQMNYIDVKQALENPEQAIKDARIRKSLGSVNITYVGDYEKLFKLVNFIQDNSITKYQTEFSLNNKKIK